MGIIADLVTNFNNNFKLTVFLEKKLWKCKNPLTFAEILDFCRFQVLLKKLKPKKTTFASPANNVNGDGVTVGEVKRKQEQIDNDCGVYVDKWDVTATSSLSRPLNSTPNSPISAPCTLPPNSGPTSVFYSFFLSLFAQTTV